MKTIITAAIMSISVIAASKAMAEPGYFLGGSIGSANLEYTFRSDLEDFSDDEVSTEKSFRAGAIYKNNSRAYASFGLNDFDGLEQRSIKISGDKLFPLASIVSLFAGVSAGATSFEDERLDETGIIYGFQVGALIHLSKNLSLEGGWSYDITTASYEYPDLTGGILDAGELSFERVSTAKFGANYIF
jgi:hypothetical protein